MHLIKSLLFLFFCLVTLVVFGQSKVTVEGQVLSNEGKVVPFANVLVDTLYLGVMADAEGKYSIEGVPAGNHEVTASFMGYKPQTKTLTVGEKSPLTLNFTLKEDVAVLDEIVIKGKTEAQKVEESGFAVNAIETKEFENQSIQANEVLDRSAGVRVRQNGGLGSRVEYNLNGMTGSSVRIFLDGIPIENYGSSFSLSSIPTALIERIEVYKGVVPAELGSDALGGAINVITKKNAPNTFNTSYSFGSFNSHQWSANGNFRDSATGFTVRGSAFYNFTNNNYKVWGDQVYVTDVATGKMKYIRAERFHDDYESVGSKIDIGFTGKKWADQFLVGVLYSGMEKDIQHGATMSNVYGNRMYNQNTLLFSSTYLKDDFLVKGLNVNLFASYSDLTRNIIDTVPYQYNWFGDKMYDESGQAKKYDEGAEAGKPTLDKAREKNFVGRVNLFYNLNDNNSIALNFLATDFQRIPDDPLRPQAERELIDDRFLNKKFIGFTYRNEAFNDRLKTSLFIKNYSQTISLKDFTRENRFSPVTSYDYSASTNRTGYGAAVSFSLMPKVIILSSVERAVRLPSSREIFGNMAENLEPAYELNPENSFNVNLGANLGPLEVKKHSVKLNTNVFYRNTTDMIRRVVASAQSETFAFENEDQILSTGLDAQLKYSFAKKVRLTSAMSIFNARFNKKYDEHGVSYIHYGDRLRNQPYFTLNNNIRYFFENFIQKDSRASVYYNVGYVHQFFRNWESYGSKNKNTIPSQLVHDIGVSYTFPEDHFTLSFDARNIFNEQVFDNWALQRPGRAFYVKVNYKLN